MITLCVVNASTFKALYFSEWNACWIKTFKQQTVRTKLVINMWFYYMYTVSKAQTTTYLASNMMVK